MVLDGAVAGVGDLVHLDDEPEGVASHEDDHDANQYDHGLLSLLTKVVLALLSNVHSSSSHNRGLRSIACLLIKQRSSYQGFLVMSFITYPCYSPS